MLERPPAIKAFDYLPKRIQKEKKVVSVPEIHLHLPTHFNVEGSTFSSAQVEKVPGVVSKVDDEIKEISPSAFKMEVGHSDWAF